MMTTLTVTHKGQITLSKAIRKALGITPGDKVAVQIADKQALIRSLGRVILDLAVTLGTLKLPINISIDDVIDETAGEEIEKEIR